MSTLEDAFAEAVQQKADEIRQRMDRAAAIRHERELRLNETRDAGIAALAAAFALDNTDPIDNTTNQEESA